MFRSFIEVRKLCLIMFPLIFILVYVCGYTTTSGQTKLLNQRFTYDAHGTPSVHVTFDILPIYFYWDSCCKQICKRCGHYLRIRRMKRSGSLGMTYFTIMADFATSSTHGVPNRTVKEKMPIVSTKETL